MIEHRIVFLSPAGTTARSAEMIAQALNKHQVPVKMVSLNHQRRALANGSIFNDWPDECCLWIGTPVYCDHALPLIDDFIDALPKATTAYSVPFATWGGVTSGTTLMEMAQRLSEKNYPVIGAAKILAVHSCMWKCDSPLGASHPNQEDAEQITALVEETLGRLNQPNVPSLPLERLDYLSETLKQDAAQKSLAKAKAGSPPPQANPAACIACGTCVSKCPMDAIVIDPIPQMSDDCIRCLMCVRCCPQHAFPFNQPAYEDKIRGMRACSDEPMTTEIFL
nr:EFR1 family ferrodoxin [uncultured Desulfuromonas sp.]